MNRKLATAAALFVTLATSSAFADDSAYQQLVNASSGTQSTGKTFDGSHAPQPSDAYPKASSSSPPVASSTSTYSGSSSSGTASGYTVSNSSSTTSATPPAGTKTAK
jgi:hypothetical protein